VTASFLAPVLYLAALGIGLGTLVDRHSSLGVTGYPYLDFLAPGLMAATAMQIGFNDSLFPVMSAFKWGKQYVAMIATPASARDIVLGQVAWIATRLLIVASSYFVVLCLFGLIHSATAVLAIPFAALTGCAFVTPTVAFVATQQNDNALTPIYRMVIVPLFLFSGAFFPVSELPGWLATLARLSPLYQGVALCRDSTLYGLNSPIEAFGHIAYLGGITVIGLVVASRTYSSRLVV